MKNKHDYSRNFKNTLGNSPATHFSLPNSPTLLKASAPSIKTLSNKPSNP